MKTTDATKEELQEYFLNADRVVWQGYTVKERDQRFLAWLYQKRSQTLLDELEKVAQQEKTAGAAYIKKYEEFVSENDPAEKLARCHEAIDISLKLKRLQGRWEAISKKLDELDK